MTAPQSRDRLRGVVTPRWFAAGFENMLGRVAVTHVQGSA
jgi:hypothetical protein